MLYFVPFIKDKWIFFDIGSTLADESTCYRIRFEEITVGTSITPAEFERKAIECAKQNQKGDHAAARFYGLSLPPWHKELEKPYPHAEHVLSTLKTKGYRLGVIANQSHGTAKRLDAWGLLSYMEVIVASAEEGVAKPDPAIFQLALTRAACDPHDAVMVGDRLDNDIAPANRLGMKTVWCKQGYAGYGMPTNAAEEPMYTIESLEELLRIL